MGKPFSLGKKEKLKSRKLVEELFARGKSLSVYPIRMSYQFLQAKAGEEPLLQIGVTVSRKNFKRAVDRNRIKRLLREAYRLQKIDLQNKLKEKNYKGYVFFIYVDKKKPDYPVVYEAMTKCLHILERRVMTNENVV